MKIVDSQDNPNVNQLFVSIASTLNLTHFAIFCKKTNKFLIVVQETIEQKSATRNKMAALEYITALLVIKKPPSPANVVISNGAAKNASGNIVMSPIVLVSLTF